MELADREPAEADYEPEHEEPPRYDALDILDRMTLGAPVASWKGADSDGKKWAQEDSNWGVVTHFDGWSL
jgi:hypothetical protein